jgi:UDP-N-acetylmuramoylalanine--D-glutamate ligase
MISLEKYKGKRIAVLGLARSGLATCDALVRAGAEVTAWDDKAQPTLAKGVSFRNLVDEDLNEYDALVMSPGIPHTFPSPHPVATLAKEAGVPIIGDTELLAVAQDEAQFVGITGTNGKSTTTALIGHILQRADHPTSIGGNLGYAVLGLEPQNEEGYFVLEMSSYQLELTHNHKFKVAIILNISPDHIDRHGNLDGYIAAKERIFSNQTASDFIVMGVDDDICGGLAEKYAKHSAKIIRISSKTQPPHGVSAVGGRLVDHSQSDDVILDLTKNPRLPGAHNWQNAAAAFSCCKALGLTNSQIIDGLLTFGGLEHRQEFVAKIGKTTFINDSKATNAEATEKALVCYDDIYWIVGGRAKEGGINQLLPCLNPIRQAFLVGESQKGFASTLDGRLPYHNSGTIDEAVSQAFKAAESSDASDPVVLLSPACASFDQFPSFEKRGEFFKEEVFKLANQ